MNTFCNCVLQDYFLAHFNWIKVRAPFYLGEHPNDSGEHPNHLGDSGQQPNHLGDSGQQPNHLGDSGQQPNHLGDPGEQPNVLGVSREVGHRTKGYKTDPRPGQLCRCVRALPALPTPMHVPHVIRGPTR